MRAEWDWPARAFGCLSKSATGLERARGTGWRGDSARRVQVGPSARDRGRPAARASDRKVEE